MGRYHLVLSSVLHPQSSLTYDDPRVDPIDSSHIFERFKTSLWKDISDGVQEVRDRDILDHGAEKLGALHDVLSGAETLGTLAEDDDEDKQAVAKRVNDLQKKITDLSPGYA